MRIAVAGGTGVVGRYVVEGAKAAGHDVVVLARSVGVDTRSGEGLAAALAGVQVIVDATNPGTPEEGPATEFFVESTANLQRVGEDAGVGHLVVLSIVGIVPQLPGYYGAKLAHERAALSGPVPATIVRATQFHEFPAQIILRNRQGAVAKLPNLQVQTVAARAVGQVLVEVAEEPRAGSVPDVAGPQVADLVTLARRFAACFDLGVDVEPAEPALPPGTLLPGEGARIVGPTFDEWLVSGDAAKLGRGR